MRTNSTRGFCLHERRSTSLPRLLRMGRERRKRQRRLGRRRDKNAPVHFYLEHIAPRGARPNRPVERCGRTMAPCVLGPTKTFPGFLGPSLHRQGVSSPPLKPASDSNVHFPSHHSLLPRCSILIASASPPRPLAVSTAPVCLIDNLSPFA